MINERELYKMSVEITMFLLHKRYEKVIEYCNKLKNEVNELQNTEIL